MGRMKAARPRRWVYVRTGDVGRDRFGDKREDPSVRARVLHTRTSYTVEMPDGEVREVTDADLVTGRRKPDPVTSISLGDGPRSGVEYEHPSFGMVGFYHVSIGHPGIEIHGSKVERHQHAVALRIQRGATVHHDLGQEWHNGGETVIEVLLSPARFAELISTPNRGDGVPCSIEYQSTVPGPGMVPRPMRRETEASRIADRIRDLGREAAESQAEARAALVEAISKMPKSRQKAALAAFDRGARVINDTAPFLVESATEALEHRATEAKAEVEAFVSTAIRSAGIRALGGDPDALHPGPVIEGSASPWACGAPSPRMDGDVYGCELHFGHEGPHAALGDEIEWTDGAE